MSSIEFGLSLPAQPRRGMIGTPKQIIEKLKPFIDLGMVSFQLKNEGFPDTTSLRLLVEEVLPRINV